MEIIVSLGWDAQEDLVDTIKKDTIEFWPVLWRFSGKNDWRLRINGAVR